VQVVGRGTVLGDMSRQKDTGKSFRYKATDVFEIDDQGLITKNDKYYSAWFHEGVDVEKYGHLPIPPVEL
jgi:hypothetical protein